MNDPADRGAKSSNAPDQPVSRGPRGPGAVPPQEEQEEHMELPHEREQSTHATDPTPDPAMKQAHQDLEDGQVDTDMRAAAGLSAEQREAYVPGPGGKSPSENPKAPRRSGG